MNNNYLIYNNLGILKDSQLEEISQGNHNMDYYYIAYDSYDYTNGFVTLSCTLPDGTSLPELSTSPKDFEFNGEKYKGFLFVVRDTLTAQAGVLSMTFNLKSVENDTQLCSSRLNVTIHESDVSTEPTITQAQYDQMQEVIRENTAKANEALEKANEAYSHDATLVKINGEVQQTWDATAVAEITKSEAEFLKDEHDKSLNIARPTQPTINHFTQLSIIESGYRAKATSSATEGGGAYYYSIIVFDDVQTGTYTLSAKALSSNQNSIPAIKPFDYVNGNIGANQLAEIVWEKGGGENRKHVTFDFDASNGNKLALVIYSNANGTVNTNDYIDYTDLMLNDGGLLQYQPYNSSSHITNGQADLLKSEYEKQSNKLSIELLSTRSSGVDYWVNEKGNLVLNGTCTGADFHAQIKPISLNGTYYFKCFNNDYNKKIGLVDGWSLIGSTDEGIIYYNGTIDKIWFYDLTAGYTFNNYEIELMLVEGTSEPTEFVSWYGQIIHEKDMTPLKVWENAQPSVEFISQTVSFSESVLDASLIRIDMRRNNSSYAGTLSFFVKADALGGSIPLSASFVEGSTEYRISRACTFYNHAGLYFDNAYLGATQNNNQMIPVAIYKYKY